VGKLACPLDGGGWYVTADNQYHHHHCSSKSQLFSSSWLYSPTRTVPSFRLAYAPGSDVFVHSAPGEQHAIGQCYLQRWFVPVSYPPACDLTRPCTGIAFYVYLFCEILYARHRGTLTLRLYRRDLNQHFSDAHTRCTFLQFGWLMFTHSKRRADSSQWYHRGFLAQFWIEFISYRQSQGPKRYSLGADHPYRPKHPRGCIATTRRHFVRPSPVRP